MAISQQQRTELLTLLVGMFDAAPGSDILDELANGIENGNTIAQYAANLVNSSEFTGIYSRGLTAEEFASSFIANLLGDTVDADTTAEAEAFVAGRLNAGASRDTVIIEALTALSAVAEDDPTWGAAAAQLNNKVEVAEYFGLNGGFTGLTLAQMQAAISGVTNDDATVTAKKAAIDSGDLDGVGTSGQTFTLTIGEDSFTGTSGSDVFNASVVQDNNADPVNTLENIDVLDGGAGVDTLNATISAADAAPLLSNIENINVRFASANALNLVNTSGVEQVIVDKSTAAGTVSNVGDVATLGVSNQNQAATFTGNTATTQNLLFTSVGKSQKAADQVTVTLATGATTANVTTSNSNVVVATLATVETLSIDATGSNTLDLTATAAAVEKLTVTGEGSLDLSGSGTFAAVKTVDASSNEGGVEVAVDATATTVTTGAGDDSIEYTEALVATAKVDLGAGDDTFTIAAASAKGAVVDAGAGSDTLAVVNGTHLNADAKDVYKNFETLEIGGGQGTYNMDNVSGVTAVTVGAALAAAADITNAAAGTTVAINATKSTDLDMGFALSYALKDATGTSDSVSVSLNAVDGDNDLTAEGQITVTSFTADDIETFNISSNVSGIDTDVENTDYTNTITALSGDAVKTINVTGNANLTVTSDATNLGALTKVDASAATGEVVFTAANAAQSVEFLGGSADDTYTASAQGDTINAGAGQDTITLGAGVDTVVYSAASDSVLNTDGDAHDKISSFTTGDDSIDLGVFGFTGQQSSALANKGAIASVTDLAESVQEDFFLSGGADRGVAIGTNGGNTFVFVDADKDGNFDASADLVIELVGQTIALADFGF